MIMSEHTWIMGSQFQYAWPHYKGVSGLLHNYRVKHKSTNFKNKSDILEILLVYFMSTSNLGDRKKVIMFWALLIT